MKELFINIRKSLSKDIGFVLPENDILFNKEKQVFLHKILQFVKKKFNSIC